MAKENKQNQEPSKPKGWHSRRHQSDAENKQARERYQAEHGPVARRRRATERDLMNKPLDRDYRGTIAE